MAIKYFKNYKLRKINKNDLKKLLILKNKYKIRKSMINKKKISYNEHYNWYLNLSNSNFFHNYSFTYKKKIIGSGYASNYDRKKKFCYWGIYRDMKLPSNKKYGSILLYLLLEKLFSLKEIKYLRCQVIKKNIWVKNWYLRWGHKYLYFDKKNKCHILKITRADWNTKKKNILVNSFIKNK